MLQAAALSASSCSPPYRRHVEEHCRAARHDSVPLPYACPIDHYLSPKKLAASAFLHRERSFLSNPRTPAAALRNSTATVRFCAGAAAGAGAGASCSGPTFPAEVRLPARPSASQLVATLGQLPWKVSGVEYYY